MEPDDRINSVWSREGTLFYEWKYDNLAYKIIDLYESGIDLNYSIESVLNCFNSFIPPPRANINNQTFRQPIFPHEKQKTQHHSAMPSSSPKFGLLDQGSGQRSLFGPNAEGSKHKSNTKSIAILNVKVRSLRKNLLNLEAFCSLDVQPDKICLTETLLSETDEISKNLVTGYNSFVATNRNSKGGGVMLQCNRFCSITTERKIDFQEPLCRYLQKKQTFKTSCI